MSKIDLTINREGLAHNIQKAKENNIIIPTIAQMQNPDLIPEKIKEKLSHTGLWDVDPVNLFRINWHNEAKESGGLYQKTPELCGNSVLRVRRSLPHSCHVRQVVPDRLPQGRRKLWLPGSETRDRPV